MKTTIIFAFFLMASLLLAGCTQSPPNITGNAVLPSSNAAASTNVLNPPTENTQNSNASSNPAKTFSLQEIAPHNSASDCWMAVHGKVYNVTSFIPHHPGGDAILQGCGKDATNLFETRPMGSGTPHSDRARKTMERFYIGDLKQ